MADLGCAMICAVVIELLCFRRSFLLLRVKKMMIASEVSHECVDSLDNLVTFSNFFSFLVRETFCAFIFAQGMSKLAEKFLPMCNGNAHPSIRKLLLFCSDSGRHYAGHVYAPRRRFYLYSMEICTHVTGKLFLRSFAISSVFLPNVSKPSHSTV